ncbi:hypothetical protein K6119_09465 [Paracrocinitomix mangrovi]|uniref:hypothetical protein n=1 Tax=Paracrocinitomix mangrovi TaxID=2862509 RepID=UPI001C8EA5FC|nr:hypothetical protein [Paracrocinitomix mangrovi]UKN03718.1 hypothetical protein K6119_09465 [Paracrocinitomix mangrovi]
MKTLFYTLLFVLSTSSFAQTTYKEIDADFTGLYDLNKNVITKKLAKETWIALGKPSKKGMEFIANKSGGYILVGLAKKGSNRDVASAIYKGSKIVQLDWSTPLLKEETIKKCRNVALENGLDKNDAEYSLFKFDQNGVIWYSLGGMFTDGGYYFLTIDKDFKMIEKEAFYQE